MKVFMILFLSIFLSGCIDSDYALNSGKKAVEEQLVKSNIRMRNEIDALRHDLNNKNEQIKQLEAQNEKMANAKDARLRKFLSMYD